MAKFWKCGNRASESPEATKGLTDTHKGASPSKPGIEQSALDQLAAVLKTWGRYAFDLDEIKASSINEQIEGWVRHILMATPRPSLEPDSEDKNGEQDPELAAERDWPGLNAFVLRLRRNEQSYVNRQVVGTRQVMGDFVQTLGRVLAEDQEEQTRVLSAIRQLHIAIEENAPIETLSETALHAIDLITDIAKERTQRNQGLLNELTGKLHDLRGELDAAQREMELDPLTRLYNRKAFDIQLERVFELCKLSGQPACLLMVDADHFKRINDVFGHPAGDQVLKRLANCCVQSFPRKTDFVARYGGEEFAVVLQDSTTRTAVQLAERLLDVVRDLEIEYEQDTLRITISIGIAELHASPSPSDWLQAADKALYQAKNSGRDRLFTQGSRPDPGSPD